MAAIRSQQSLQASHAGVVDRDFSLLVDRRLDESYRLARLILRNDEDAEDATHEAFLAAWRNRRALRDTERLDAWFSRILINACRQRMRQRIRRPTAPLLHDEPHTDALDPHSASDNRQAIARAFESLTGDQRVVIVLRFYQDLLVDDIARRLRIRPGTVKSRLHQATRQLRKALAKDASGVKIDE